MNDCVLVLNAGSSSLKFRLYRRGSDSVWRPEAQGPTDARDVPGALDVVADWLDERREEWKLVGVGHRVVHGGADYRRPCLVTPRVLEDLKALIPLAPLHQPSNVGAIESATARFPEVPQVACFDTAFHAEKPAVAELVPLPQEYRDAGLKRYGFHGLSYEYIASMLPDIAPEIADGRVIVAHLGSGSSLCAMKDRRSVETTHGFTALDGLCMGTRPGAIDPGVILYLLQTMKLSPDAVEELLYRKSGLLGISGISDDMRELVDNPDSGARLAVDYFVYQAAKQIGALAAALGGLDALVFTAGIGEHSAEIRRRIVDASTWLGVSLDDGANRRHGPRISPSDSRVSAWVIPTNEELMIARHTGSVLGLSGSRLR